jgi:hypothetical protein
MASAAAAWAPSAIPAVQASAPGDEQGGSLLATQGQVRVDGMVINSGASLTQSVAGGPIVGMIGGYMADIANAQEVTIQLSGALGESETGGATINIVPRTGGNRYAGNYNTTYTTNRGSRRTTRPTNININNLIQYNYDVSGAFGGPILRDRLWFYSVACGTRARSRARRRRVLPQPPRRQVGLQLSAAASRGRALHEPWRNANTRLTLQATQRNKFNIFWDEQDFCQDPCGGMVAVFTSPESWWSVQVRPNRLQQVSWTNPLTNRILLEARISITRQDNRTDMHRQYVNPRGFPGSTRPGPPRAVTPWRRG